MQEMKARRLRMKSKTTNKVAYLLALVFTLIGINPARAQYPQSPCPDIFTYQVDSNTKQIYGHVEISNIKEGQVAKLNIALSSLATELTQDNIGSITLVKTREATLNDIVHGNPTQYLVNFPLQNFIPTVLNISLNGQTICTGYHVQDDIMTTIFLGHTLHGQPQSNHLINLPRPQPQPQQPVQNQSILQPQLQSESQPSPTNQSQVSNTLQTPQTAFTQPAPTAPTHQVTHFIPMYTATTPNQLTHQLHLLPQSQTPVQPQPVLQPQLQPQPQPSPTNQPQISNESQTHQTTLTQPAPTHQVTHLSPMHTTATPNQLTHLPRPQPQPQPPVRPQSVLQPQPQPQPQPTTTNRMQISNEPQTSRTIFTQPVPTYQVTLPSRMHITIAPPVSSVSYTCGKISSSIHNPSSQFPWIAPLFEHSQTSEPIYICGSTIINNKHLITAAHCVYELYDFIAAERILAIPGMYNIDNFADENAMLSYIESVHPHDHYVHEDDLNDADIAILKMKKELIISEHIIPICLWNADNYLEQVVNQEGIIAGWGWSEQGRTSIPTYIKATVVSLKSCRDNLEKMFPRNLRVFFGDVHGSAPYNSDSGNGFIMKRDNQYFLRGVVSRGWQDLTTLICDDSKFTIYTDVAPFLYWIRRIMSQ